MYLSVLKEEEKNLFLDLVYYVAAADGNVGEEEKEIIKAYCTEMSISSGYEKASLSFEQVIERIENLADEREKKIILFEILGLALADNRYDENERNLIHTVARKFELSEDFIIKCENIINEYVSFQTKINSLILG